MAGPSTTDGTCIVRVWLEGSDWTLRGRVESVPGDGPVAARGVPDLLRVIQVQLEVLQRRLAERSTAR